MRRWARKTEPEQVGLRQPLLTFGHPAARSRLGDPGTSLQAAIEVEHKDIGGSQRERVLRGVVLHRGWTSAELALTLRMERHQPARRLKEIEESGLIERGEARECRVCGRQSLTWWPSAWTLEMLAQGYSAEELLKTREEEPYDCAD